MPLLENIFLGTTLVVSIATGNIPGAIVSCIGLSAAGPIAGGLFAQCQSCHGAIQADSCMSNIQSCSMTTANTVRGIATICVA